MADEATHSDDGSSPPAKRKKASASSRGVANLTPDQLARKRANDREAQRAIRERTRNQIDTLHARIKELESAQPYLDLQAALRQRDAALTENEHIRRKLATVIGILQPLADGNSGLNELAAAAERIPIQEQTGTAGYETSVAPTGHDNGAEGSPSQSAVDERHWHNSEGSGASARGWVSGNSTWEPARDNLDPSLQYGQSDERLGVEFLLDNNQRAALQNGVAAAQSQASLTPDPHTRSASVERSLEAWQTLPKFLPATCPLDSLLLDFLNERVRMLRSGVSPSALIGPEYPNFDSIIDPKGSHKAHPVSKICTDIVRTFPSIGKMSEQVAVVYIMFLVVRWLAHPTRETYDAMPDWIQPKPSQLFKAYPHWATCIPWPRLRDRIAITQAAPPFDQFFIPFTSALSVNWPYAQADSLRQNPNSSDRTTTTTSAQGSGDDDTEYPTQWIIDPAFEAHLRDLGNWSVGPAFLEAFPSYAGTVKVKEGNG